MILTLIQSMIFERGCITRTTVLLRHLWLHTHLSLTSCLYYLHLYLHLHSSWIFLLVRSSLLIVISHQKTK